MIFDSRSIIAWISAIVTVLTSINAGSLSPRISKTASKSLISVFIIIPVKLPDVSNASSGTVMFASDFNIKSRVKYK